MKFEKVKKDYLFPTYVREDGLVQIKPSAIKQEFKVYDKDGRHIDTIKLLRDAKEKYQ